MNRLRNIKTSMLYFDTFLATMHREWMGIDRLRMDKFYLLFRFMLQNAFICLKNNDWDDNTIDWLMSILRNGPLSPIAPGPGASRGPPLGIRYHTVDIFIEELSACADATVPAEKIMLMLLPFCNLVCHTPVRELRDKAIDKIFQEIVDRSEPARKIIREATDGNDSDADDEEASEKLNIDYSALADTLFEMANRTETLPRNRKKVYKIVKKLRGIAEGHMPLDDFPDLLPDDESDPKGEKLEVELCTKLSKDWEEEYRRNKKEKLEASKTKRKRRRLEDVELGEGNPSDFLLDDATANLSDNAENTQFSSKTKKKKEKRKDASRSNASNVIQGNNVSIDDMQDDDCVDVNSSLAELVDFNETSATDADTSDQRTSTGTVKTSKKRKLGRDHLTEADVDFSHGLDVIATKRRRKSLEKRKRLLDLLQSDSSSAVAEDKSSPRSAAGEQQSTVSLQTQGDPESASNESPPKRDLKEAPAVDTRENNASSRTAARQASAVVVEKDTSTEGDKKFVQFAKAFDSPPKSAFLRFAASKVAKARPSTEPRKKLAAEPSRTRSSKRVSFEMSRIQVKPFRKNDKSIALSSSPLSAAFDPNKTPDFGLLKSRKPKHQNEKKLSAA